MRFTEPPSPPWSDDPRREVDPVDALSRREARPTLRRQEAARQARSSSGFFCAARGGEDGRRVHFVRTPGSRGAVAALRSVPGGPGPSSRGARGQPAARSMPRLLHSQAGAVACRQRILQALRDPLSRVASCYGHPPGYHGPSGHRPLRRIRPRHVAVAAMQGPGWCLWTLEPIGDPGGL